MTSDLHEKLISQWAEFWQVCVRLLANYLERSAAMSRDAEVK